MSAPSSHPESGQLQPPAPLTHSKIQKIFQLSALSLPSGGGASVGVLSFVRKPILSARDADGQAGERGSHRGGDRLVSFRRVGGSVGGSHVGWMG
jgi:hypothetical protein